MKKILYIIALSQFLCTYSFSKKNNFDTSKDVLTYTDLNKIDNLKSTEDVINFAKSINPDFAREYSGELQIKSTDLIINELSRCDLYKVWNIQNWQKIDLNNDSKTDLLFTAYWYDSYHQYAIVYVESDKYKLFILSDDIDYDCKIVKPIIVDNKNELLVNTYETDPETVSQLKMIHFVDTLTYKFNYFIEKSKKTSSYDIEHLKFISKNNFEIEIDNNQNAHYTCLDVFNVSHLRGNFYKGESTKKIDKAIFKDISNLLEYINVSDLPNEFYIDGYDFTTVWLEIKFADGSVKKITDYGYQGTYGLNATYDKMQNIALQTDWE